MRTPLTQAGAERLRQELQHLKKVMRPRIIEEIAAARAHGDLRENAEYHAAREEQGFTEGRIQRLEAGLSTAQIIEVTKLNANGKVVFGATVTVLHEESGEQTTYQIVGDLEADATNNQIAVSSPIARALIGRVEGDTVTVETPGGEREYEIVVVAYI
jgi:transcription elongation factor GreA